MKEIKKYVGLYLFVYIFVLVICGIFQFVSACNGASLECVLNTTEINTIVSTTSYVLTPLVAIIGFLSWKNQYNKVTVSQLSKEIYKSLDEENLLAYKYRGCIKPIGTETENDIVMRYDLLNKSNQLYDQIRLLCKLTNSRNLEKLNDYNRTAVSAIVLNIDIKIENNVNIEDVRKNYYANYNEYSESLKQLRSELSNYILV
ncbi:hypothetical protein D3C78_139620 [compost metagenome]